jgi:hypothetical protein
MKARGYRIALMRRLEEVPADSVSSEWDTGGDCFWIDIEGSCREAMAQYGGNIEIDPILMQLCEEDPEEIARVIPTDEAIFFGLPVSTGSEDESVVYLGAFCLPRLLITLHPLRVESLERFARALQRTSVLDAPTTSSLVYALLIHLSTQSVELAQKLRRRVGDGRHARHRGRIVALLQAQGLVRLTT